MSSCNIPERVWYNRPGKHAPAWKPGIGEAPRLPVTENPLHTFFEDRSFLLREVFAEGTGNAAKLLFISDLHWDGGKPEVYRRLAAAVNKLEPDIIVFGGDLCTFTDSMNEALEWIDSLKAPLRLAVPGNRETVVCWHNTAWWRENYNSAGYKLLCNEVVELENLVIFGLDDARFGKPDWTPLASYADCGKTVLGISHSPDAVGDAGENCYLGDAVLCGHTHGGQLNLPLIGPLYTSSSYGRQFAHGWCHRNDGTLCLTSSGIGESGFFFMHRRLFCPRELVLFHVPRRRL